MLKIHAKLEGSANQTNEMKRRKEEDVTLSPQRPRSRKRAAADG